MAKLMCVDCFKTFDSLIGHYCINARWISGDVKRSIIVKAKERNSLVQGSVPRQCVEINETAIISRQLDNINLEFSNKNYLSHQVTCRNDEQICSNKDLKIVRKSNDLMTKNSEHGHIGKWVVGGLNSQSLRVDWGSNKCNDAMGLGFDSSEIALKINRRSSMICQLRLHEDNRNIPWNPDSSINIPDFATLNEANDMLTYEFPKLEVFEDVQLEPIIQSDSSELMNNLVEGRPGYQISETNNAALLITKDRRPNNSESITGNKLTTGITISNFPLTEIHNQFSKFGKNENETLLKDDLDNTINNLAVNKKEPSRRFLVNSSPTVYDNHRSSSHAGSINDQVRLNRTNTVTKEHECNDTSKEFTLGLDEVNFTKGLEETEIIGISWSENFDHVDDYPANAVPVLAISSLHPREISSQVYLKNLQSNANVKRLSVLHTDVKHFICTVCHKVFEEKSYLNKHMLIHEEATRFACSVCGLSFTRKSALKTHVLKHEDKKPFQCEECGTRFSEKDGLRKHSILHTSEKPYSCKVCGKSFARSPYLKAHYFTHTSDKPHECIICRKKFLLKHSLNKHKKTHKSKRQNTVEENIY
ncbi:unnamed protein product [Larinioides sclopetarius]|uniref:C2H2-type domain-containing protein n=1 Tax=Larinioides sclopetarius TaxID=280406 RepID=A0AAV2BKQ3_9ARAC